MNVTPDQPPARAVIRFLSAQALSVPAGVMMMVGLNRMASIETPLGPYYGFDLLGSGAVLALAGIVLASVALATAGRSRILVGPDAYLFDALLRIAPTHYYSLLAGLESGARAIRKGAR